MRRTIARRLLAALAPTLLVMPSSIAAICPDGSIAIDDATSTLVVQYLSLDDTGSVVQVVDSFALPNQFKATAVVTQELDPITQVYSYTYKISNASESAQQIVYILFAVPPEIAAQTSLVTSAPTAAADWLIEPELTGPQPGIGCLFRLRPDRTDMSTKGIPPGGFARFSLTAIQASGSMGIYLLGGTPPLAYSGEPSPCVEELVDEFLGFPNGYTRIEATGPSVGP